ncbi:MAG: hypothetical protein ACP5UD_04980 [Conexivisphaera sp.]
MVAKSRAISTMMIVAVLAVIVVAGAGAFLYASTRTGSSPGSTQSSTSARSQIIQVNVMSDSLLLPASGGATWSITLQNPGPLAVKGAEATLLTGLSTNPTLKFQSIQPGTSSTQSMAGITGVEGGTQYVVDVVVQYSNGSSQLITQTIQTTAPYAGGVSFQVTDAEIMESGGSPYLVLSVENTGSSQITSLYAEAPQGILESIPVFSPMPLSPGQTATSSTGLSGIQAGQVYSVIITATSSGNSTYTTSVTVAAGS